MGTRGLRTKEQIDAALKNTRPAECKDHHLRCLDLIRDSGSVNMWGGAEPLREIFPELSEEQSAEILIYWMKTFTSRRESRNVKGRRANRQEFSK